jgi:hypothetical protein
MLLILGALAVTVLLSLCSCEGSEGDAILFSIRYLFNCLEMYFFGLQMESSKCLLRWMIVLGGLN